MGIHVLYPGDERSVDVNLSLNLDIIAIHGLNGNSLRTWTEPKSQKLWLRDFLPKNLPKARVMTFGYNATAVFDDSTANIVDHARDLLGCLVERRAGFNEVKRPLIFIGHSLGGLVTKQALILAEKELRFKGICNSTVGIIFFGTPHQGSSFASYALFLAKIPTVVANKPDPELLKTLRAGSEVLNRLTEEFKEHHQVRRYPIVSFYEMRTMLGMKKLIVEKTSAIMTPPHKMSDEEKIPVLANHQEMCRFSSPKDQTYRRAVDAIKRIYCNGTEIDVPEKNECCILPHRLNSLFTGRDEIRQKLQDCLLPNRYARVREQQRFVLFGLGGSGKTQLALRFANDFKERFKYIFWIDATTPSTALDSFLAIANTCSLEQDVDSVKAWVASRDHWLLIIDNADDPNVDISRLFPCGSRGAILITTRVPDLQQYASAGVCKIDELNDEDATTLLLKASAAPSIQDPEARGAALKVGKTLGNLALAIVQAGAVIRQGICSLDGFCKLYSMQKRELLEVGRPTASIDYQYSVNTTWEISIQKIEEMRDSEANLALELLRLFSFMHFDGIREDAFKNARDNAQDFREGCIFQRTSTYQLMPSGWDPLVLAKALRILVEFSLITIDDSRNISMHPLVHEWSRERMSDEQRARTWEMAASTLAMSIQQGFTFSHYQYRRALLPHIDTCVNSKEGRHMLLAVGLHIEERMLMAEKFALAYKEGGRYQEALTLEVGRLDWKKSALPRESLAIPRSMESVAACLQSLSKFEKAKVLREELLEMVQKRLGDGSYETLTAMRGLATSYEDLGQYQKASTLLIEALNGFKAAFGDEGADTLLAKACLARCYFRLKRWKDAAKLQEEVLRVNQRNLGETHSSTLLSILALALSYDGLKQKRKAHRMRKQSLVILKATLGEHHPNTLVTMVNSATDTSWSERKQSIATIKEALRRMQDTLGDLDMRTLNCTAQLAESYFSCGALQKAKILQEKALSGMIDVLGYEHPETAASRKELALINMAIAARKVCYWWLPQKVVGS